MIVRNVFAFGLVCTMMMTLGCELKKKQPSTKDGETSESAETRAQPVAPEDCETPGMTAETTEWLRSAYDKARTAGETVPNDVKEWARQDVKKIGSWDYKIITFLPSDTTLAMEQELQRLGSERWNCFFVEASDTGRVFYFKKSKRSYLQAAGKLSTLIPISGDGGEQ